MPSRGQRIYAGCALQLMNLVVLFVLVNVAVGFGFTWHDKHTHPDVVPNLAQKMLNVPTGCKLGMDPSLYQGAYTSPQLDEILDNFIQLSALGFPYAPWVGYEVPLFHSPLVNIDPGPDKMPRRRSLELVPDPPGTTRVLEVWCFGGSTTFSVNVADADTLPSCLERALERQVPPGVRVRVSNWGRPGYYSTQEVRLFETVLKTGARPDAVIFLDGVNDVAHLAQGPDYPLYTQEIRDLVKREQIPDNGLRHYTWIPLVRLAFVLRSSLQPPEPVPSNFPLQARRVLQVYHDNIEMVQALCTRYGVACYFFWQPVSFFRHNLLDTPCVPYDLYKHQLSYREAYARVEATERATIPLSTLVDRYGDPRMFLDYCHYTPKFIRYVSLEMAAHLDLAVLMRHHPGAWEGVLRRVTNAAGVENSRLDHIEKAATADFSAADRAREQALRLHREVIRCSGLSIRAIHRGEFDEAARLIGMAGAVLADIRSAIEPAPEVYYAGFVQDAQKEFAEANVTLALVTGAEIPGPDRLGVDVAAYMNGMAEAIGELRRYIMDNLRRGDDRLAESHLELMDEIYYVLVTMDFPDALTRGLRRSTDVARSLIEKTRGELTNHLQNKKLQAQLEHFRARLSTPA